ncbi:MAG: dTDP-4-dehydrorhamnose 3,5-epimerase [Acholeplasmatales bacterium]|nr:dTDP-4-dehydrorhamnose 3,5-epimerase [Acholeplasmatales bacterium]
MKAIRQLFKDVLVLEPDVESDERGSVVETYSEDDLDSIKIDGVFIEEKTYNSIKSATVYGIYYQEEPYSQNKLIYPQTGSVMVYAIEFDPESENYLQWICVELDSRTNKQLYLPNHYAYCILTLEANTRFVVKADEYNTEGYLRVTTYLDKTINLEFPFDEINGVYKEKNAPSL